VVWELGRGIDMDVWVCDGGGWGEGMVWESSVFDRDLVSICVSELVGK
jgi:hypothetical protein